MENLNEKFADLLESKKYDALSETDTGTMARMLESTEKEMNRMISEGTLAGDVAQFTPILMPMVRRVYPNLIANELLGVQPMAMPTGFIYALTNSYAGTDNNKVTPLNSGAAPYTIGGIVVDFAFTAGTSGLTVADIVEGVVVTGSNSGAVGTIAYVEGGKALINVTSGAFTTLDTASTTGLVGDETISINAIYTNEAAFGNIFTNYTGTYTTAQAELLGKDMKEVGFSIGKKSVEAKSRALKGQYSVEMYQDLKAQHGLLADEEIMSLMSYELQAEIDREIVNFVNASATNVPNASDISFSVGTDAATAAVAAQTGRWEIEKYRREVIKISKESKIIGLDTKRGTGNILIVSPQVVTMLEQVGSFKTAEQTSGVINPIAGGVAGTFDNKYKVIVDQFTTSDYATVLYKGADRRDAMGFFAPYVPLSFTKVTHADSGQPAVIAKTRYALDAIPGISTSESGDRAAKYARTFGVSFANTALA
jgi:hypothetical protein